MKKGIWWAWRSPAPPKDEKPSKVAVAVSSWSWRSPAPPKDEKTSKVAVATSDVRGGSIGASPEAVEEDQGAWQLGGPPRRDADLLKSKSHRGPRGHAAPASGGPRAAGLVEGRRSASQVEANAGWVAASLHVKVIAADMPEFMQMHAFRCARHSYDGQLVEKLSCKQIAHDIKKEFDKVYGPVWHCVIGSSFGSFVTHSTGCFLCFSMEKLLVLVFKTRIRGALA